MPSLNLRIFLLFAIVCLEVRNSDLNVMWHFLGLFYFTFVYKTRAFIVSPIPLLVLLFVLICWNWFSNFLHWLDFRVLFMNYCRAFLTLSQWAYNYWLYCYPFLWIWLDNFHAQAVMVFISNQSVNAAGTPIGFYYCPLWFHLWFINVFNVTLSEGAFVVCLLF